MGKKCRAQVRSKKATYKNKNRPRRNGKLSAGAVSRIALQYDINQKIPNATEKLASWGQKGPIWSKEEGGTVVG